MFDVQVYGPCILLVVISWVSFWLNREATSDRISLGSLIIFWVLMKDWNIISRDNHCPHHDLPGTGGKEGPAQGSLPHRPGLLCFHFLHLHLLNSGPGISQWEQRIRYTELKLYRSEIPKETFEPFNFLPNWGHWRIKKPDCKVVFKFWLRNILMALILHCWV